MKQNTKKTLKFFLKHVKNYKFLAIFMVFGLIVGATANLTWPIIFRHFFDTLLSTDSKDIVVQSLFQTLILLMVNEAIDWMGWRLAHYLDNRFLSSIMRDIANECFESIHKHSYRFFTDNFAGALVKKINRITRGFQRVSDKIFWDMGSMSLKIIIILGVLLYVNPLLSLIVAIWSVIFIATNYWFSIYKLRFDIPRSKEDSRVTAALADTITNSTNVKLFSALNYELRRFKTVTERWYKINLKASNIGAHIEAGQAALMIILEFIILYVAIQLWQKDLIKTADFFLIQAYIMEMFHQLWTFGRNLRELYEALADSEEMTEILNFPHEIVDAPNATALKLKDGMVEFKKVKFAYSKKSEQVIKNLSFKIKAGEKIALIGPSGGGKSTMVKLLLRLFDVQSGQILMDSHDIADVTQDSLRKQIALVPQEPIMFHRTIMENIRYGRRSASDKEVIAAAKMAHCHDFIMKFPDKYKTFVGERGIKLSGGQRQRVAIARAILSNAKILILDEATSSLDSESEKLIQDALENLLKNKTSFIIAHRLSTIMKADRIFVLEGGKIIEEGTHGDLLSKKSSLYKKLWDLQVGGYL